MTEKELQLGQLEKLLASRSLHGSESLCKLLRYLAHCSLEHPGSSPKEYQIATELFGRQQDFDPHVDSMVRVQAGRLRTKLSEYYATEGAEDPIQVEIPKGTYALTFHSRPTAAAKSTSQTAPKTSEAARSKEEPRPRWIAVLLPAAIVMTAVLSVFADRELTKGFASGSTVAMPAEPPAVFRVFWRGFLTGPQEPWVIFSNATFVGRPDTGMRYYNLARDGRTNTFDHYTGVGEVLAVHALDKVFSALRQDVRVKRGSLFSLDDAKNNDLIFIGSPSENLALLEIPSTQEFVFKQVASGPRAGNMEILNVHPQSGEPKLFLATPSEQPLTEEYSVIALVKGLDPAHSELILAGTTTIGTQAAVEYVCQQNSLQELLLRLSVSSSGELKPFEAVIRVKVVKGVPVGSELVALRKGPA
ncbi:MAG: hypothetical protein ABSH39_20390 [Candidatus Acidiferrum sp.]